jgi:3'-phosphoadenosine 5'-phosphosulfate (PAPS) 3'-phosphatase
MIEKVIDIAKEIGDVALRYQGLINHDDLELVHEILGVTYKEGNRDNPVTLADVETDRIAREKIKNKFPGCQILSEEHNPQAPIDYSTPVWIVDSLDGTKDFIQGKPFSVIMGLCVGGVPVLGVVYAPQSQELWYAEPEGKPHYQKGDLQSPVEIQVSSCSALEDASLITMSAYKEERNKLDGLVEGVQVKETIFMGSTGLKICTIASGGADVHADTSLFASKWDTAGAESILRAAGGELTDWLGNRPDYTRSSARWPHSYVVSNGILHKPFLDALRDEKSNER